MHCQILLVWLTFASVTLSHLLTSLRVPEHSFSCNATTVPISGHVSADGQVLSGHIFCHVPCPRFNYRGKIIYIAICLRRMMAAIIDPTTCLDDRCATLSCTPLSCTLVSSFNVTPRMSYFGVSERSIWKCREKRPHPAPSCLCDKPICRAVTPRPLASVLGHRPKRLAIFIRRFQFRSREMKMLFVSTAWGVGHHRCV